MTNLSHNDVRMAHEFGMRLAFTQDMNRLMTYNRENHRAFSRLMEEAERLERGINDYVNTRSADFMFSAMQFYELIDTVAAEKRTVR